MASTFAEPCPAKQVTGATAGTSPPLAASQGSEAQRGAPLLYRQGGVGAAPQGAGQPLLSGESAPQARAPQRG